MGKISEIARVSSTGSDTHLAMAEGFAELGWEVLQLGNTAAGPMPVEVDFALAHPDHGVALIDLMRAHPEPVARLRARLEAQGFGDVFPGHLPIVHCVLGVQDLWRLSMVLDPSFRAEPPMGITGRAWIARVQQALLPDADIAFAAPPPRPNEPEPPAPVEPAAPVVEQPQAAEPEPVEDPPEADLPRLASWTEAPPVAEPAPAPPPPERSRRSWWLLPIAGIAAAIGLSHHLVLPEGWKLELPLLHAARPMEPQAQAIPAAVAAEPTSPAIPPLAVREEAPSPDPVAPLPEEEPLRLDFFRPVAAQSVPEPQPPARSELPPAEVVRLLAAQRPEAQPAPEEGALIAPPAVAPAVAEEPVGMLEAPTVRLEPAEPAAALPDPPPAAMPAPPQAVLPVRVDPVLVPPPAELELVAAQQAAELTLPRSVIDMLIARGDEMLAHGDISGARLLYARAASAGSAAAARAMALSFEPEVLSRLGVRGIRPDPEQARLWHQRAEDAR